MPKRSRIEQGDYKKVESKPVSPQSSDVLLGRGRAIAAREGNQRFQEEIEHNTERYSQAQTKTDKMRIVIEIVERIKLWGRFLDQPRAMGLWYEADDLKVRKKVGQALRYHLNHPRTPELSRGASTITNVAGLLPMEVNPASYDEIKEDNPNDDSSFDISLTAMELDGDSQPPLLTDMEILVAVGYGDLAIPRESSNKKKKR